MAIVAEKWAEFCFTDSKKNHVNLTEDIPVSETLLLDFRNLGFNTIFISQVLSICIFQGSRWTSFENRIKAGWFTDSLDIKIFLLSGMHFC